MHVYLIVAKDFKSAFVFTNVLKGKDKESELGEDNVFVYEWMELWCRPLKYKGSSEEYIFDDGADPWKMLKLAYKQGNWNARAKYREDIFNEQIEQKSK